LEDKKIEGFNGLSIFDQRRDVWILYLEEIPIGVVVVVKKPGVWLVVKTTTISKSGRCTVRSLTPIHVFVIFNVV
jgi:hypothetical protein